jgi:hypothetical protein
MKMILWSLLILFSCSKITPIQNTPIIDDWFVLDNAMKENWNKIKLEEMMGKPHKLKRYQDNQTESYIYNDSKTQYQEWIISFDPKGFITEIFFNPHPTIFMDELRKHWADLKCFEKTEPSKIPHIIRNQRYLSCEGGKLKAYYSKYDEVESISVSK